MDFFRKEPPAMSCEEFSEKYLRPAVSELWDRFMNGTMTVDDRVILGSILGVTIGDRREQDRES